MTQLRSLFLFSFVWALVLPAHGWAQESAADQAQILHMLNRLTYGPRPGDVDMVRKMGLRTYVQSQLHPETIDDSAVEQVVAGFELLQMTAPQLTELYHKEFEMNAKKRAEDAQREKDKAAGIVPASGPPPQMTMATEATPITEKPGDSNAAKRKARRALIAGIVDPSKPWRSSAAIGQMEQAKLVRAVDSQRQLQEVLVDFWGNHFNIDMSKKDCRVLKIVDDREVIRPHILGKFRDLVGASAHSPAMLIYLDNSMSTKVREMPPAMQAMQPEAMKPMAASGEEEPAMMALKAKMKANQRGGLNENYARELMELHTLGVDGGYTQQDVQEVARCFTGWSVEKLSGEFIFRRGAHDNGEKTVLGHKIPAGGGMKDGEMVLDILVAQPACAKFISRKLCQRFVADSPPASLVDRVAGVFTQSGGDLRQVTEAILTSPEFMAPANYGNKIKSPLEFAVSALRASDSTLIAHFPFPKNRLFAAREGAGAIGRAAIVEKISKEKRQSLNWHILELGQPLFVCAPPTGYKEVSSVWVSPGALIERLNFALALTQQDILDVQFDAGKILAGIDVDKPDAVLQRCVSALLQDNISATTRKVLEETALPTPGENKTLNPAKLIALMIGSPEFQRK